MAETRYALFQNHLAPPPVSQLQQALRHVPGLVPADAHALVQDAFGIVVKNLALPVAQQLQSNLADLQIETTVVAQSDIPTLPASRFVRRVECLPDRLQVDDALGRPQVIPWSHIRVLAAGWIEPSTAESHPRGRRSSDTALVLPKTSRPLAADSGLAPAGQGYLEIVLFGLSSRLTIDVRDAALIRGGVPDAVLLELAGILAAHAPACLKNRGVHAAQQQPPCLFRYPTRNAFHEELIWMLWKAQAGEDEAPPLPAARG